MRIKTQVADSGDVMAANQKAPARVWIWTGEPYQWHDTKTADSDVEYVRADLFAAVRAKEREAAFNEALLREPVRIDMLPPLVVTRDGVPCPDQAAALKEFKQACAAG